MRYIPGLCLAGLALAAAALAPASAEATVIFSDTFDYATGNLAGKNGGTGWSGGWTGGSSLVAGNLPGTTGNSVAISSTADITARSLSSSYTTGGATSYYLSFLFNASPMLPANGGDYAGISLTGAGTSFFSGIPGSSGQIGFDWQNEGDGLFSATSGTTYLVLLELTAGSTSGLTMANFHITSNLATTGTALADGTPEAFLEGQNFSFASVEIAGGYSSGSVSLAGLALATSANEAVSLTVAAIPESSATGWLAAGLLLAAGAIRRRRRA